MKDFLIEFGLVDAVIFWMIILMIVINLGGIMRLQSKFCELDISFITRKFLKLSIIGLCLVLVFTPLNTDFNNHVVKSYQNASLGG